MIYMSCTRLPLELIHAILEHLHDDNRALAACSLVCKAWVHSARCHLFADAILDKTSIEKFLKSKTAAIPFVRYLYFNAGFCLQFWNEYLPLLVSLKSIRSFEMELPPLNEMTPNAQSVLLSQFASVVRLCLTNSGVTELSRLAQVICAFPCLKTLVINGAFWLPEDSIPSTLCPPHSLRALELRNCAIERILEWFLSFERMPPLHTVYLHRLDSDSFHILDKFLQSLGPSLEVFSYCLYGFFGLSGELISLGHNTRLCSLHFELNRSTNISDIARTLSQKIVSTHIDEVRFTFLCHLLNDEDEWDRVDKILTQPPFSDFKRVEFFFFNSQSPGLSAQDLANFKVWAVTRLPRCSSRGILSVYEDSRKKFTYL